MSLVRVGEIAEQVRGVTYGKSDASTEHVAGTLPLFRANNVQDGSLEFDDLIYVASSCVTDKQMLRRGDILVVTSSGSLSSVGKAAQFDGKSKVTFGAFCKVIRPSSKVEPSYLGHFFRTPDYRRKISSLASGANINNLKSEHIDNLEIPLPPLHEQRRIAAILDQADALRRKRREAIAKFSEFERVIFETIFGDPRTNPNALPTKKLGDLIKVSSGQGLVASDQRGGCYPVYGGNGINGWHDEFTVDCGTIVVGRVGVYCGAVHVTDKPAWVTDNALIVKKLGNSLRSSYLAAALKYADLNQYAGKSAQPLVSGSRIYPVEILHPNDVEQERYEIAARELALVQSQAINHLAHLDALFASLQHRAFRGEL